MFVEVRLPDELAGIDVYGIGIRFRVAEEYCRFVFCWTRRINDYAGTDTRIGVEDPVSTSRFRVQSIDLTCHSCGKQTATYDDGLPSRDGYISQIERTLQPQLRHVCDGDSCSITARQ